MNWETAKVDELSYQIERIDPHGGLYGAVWQTPSSTIWNNACYDSRPVYTEEVRKLPTSVGVKNLYIPHATFNEPDLAKPRNPPRFERRSSNLHSTRTLVIDGDVKPGAFSSSAECKQAVCSRLADFGLKPSFIVYTGAPIDSSAARSDVGHAHLPDHDALASARCLEGDCARARRRPQASRFDLRHWGHH